MNKIVLVLVASMVSLSCYASDISSDTNNLKNALENTMQPNATTQTALMYGGQDISSPVIAIADETLWKGNTGYVG